MAQPANPAAPHTRPATEVVRELASHAALGLEDAEALARLRSHGANAIVTKTGRGPWRILLDQFSDFMIVVLLGAAVVSGVIGDVVDTAVIAVIVVLNAAVGFVQEYRAENAMAALRQLAAPHARVLRGGHARELPAAELVPGDVVLLEAGALVPADLRLLEAAALATQEAALTGESAAVTKTVEPEVAADAAIGERTTMVYKGTLVAHGRGRGIVVATGMDTELGRIARLLQGAEAGRTPLQQRLARFGRALTITVLALCAVIFLAGLARGEPLLLMLLTAISLAVAAIPEALPAVVTLALALGARRMVRHAALIRSLPAVETLGSITYICVDKTGTLTLNRMRLEEWQVAGDRRAPPPLTPPQQPGARELLTAMALNHDVHLDPTGAPVGDPTEVALFEAARDAGFDAVESAQRLPRTGELPFDAARGCMTTLHRGAGLDDALVGYTKGAPEHVLALCVRAHGGQAFDREAVLRDARDFAADGLRVLAYARRVFATPPPLEPDAVESGLEYLGLVALLDPPRPEAAAAIADCRQAGIVAVMITGDHPDTARAVARRIGLLPADGEVLSGIELDRMSDEAFASRVARVRVYARAAPEHKLRIVRMLQQRGEYVAMTGDGVNDAPALKRADIGVAMNITGTDVAKETAHMTLLDDNFATIVRAVQEGRRIYDNIRKFIRYSMTSNSGEIWTILLAPFLGMPIPLLPIHILWVNLVTDGLPGLALASEPAERNTMRRPPRPPAESVFAHGVWQHSLWVGVLMGAATLATQAWALQQDIQHWQSMVFTVLTLSQLGHVLAVRSERDSIFSQGLWSNAPLAWTVLLTVALQLSLLYVPWFNLVFHTAPLSTGELAWCLMLSSAVFLAVEAEKWFVRRGLLYRDGRGAGDTR